MTKLFSRHRRRCAAAILASLTALTLATPSQANAASRVRATPEPACSRHAGTKNALRVLTQTYGLAGAAVDASGPTCGGWNASSGVADLRTGRAMRADERIRIGSTTKTFTATVVLQLAAEGRIALDTPVERYLPGVVQGNGYDGRRMTVRALLQHTSGMPDHVDALDWDSLPEWRYRKFTPDELVALALGQPHPDRSWTYSTTNYVLAGMIVERITGHPIGAEITRRIIRPLGLRDTYWPGNSPYIRGPHPRGYYPANLDPASTDPAGDPQPKLDLTDVNMSFGDAGGALISSLSDENRFFAALFDGRLVSLRYLRQMMTTVEADPDRVWPGARYGLGLISTPLRRCGVDLYWGHGGTTPGFKTLGGITPDGRRVQLVINDTITSQEAYDALTAAVHTALCETE
ncbi:MAG TPA: serine hydrolase domain-containing protein [Kineosporiaceae bacterium]|nr:serine hydrolase domain-containing protein [Kineosporiaceae bacterium]